MSLWTKCPTCSEPMEVNWENNGVCFVLHGTHCGWGHAYFAPEDCFKTPDEVLNEKEKNYGSE